jgi:hypothetical protein
VCAFRDDEQSKKDCGEYPRRNAPEFPARPRRQRRYGLRSEICDEIGSIICMLARRDRDLCPRELLRALHAAAAQMRGHLTTYTWIEVSKSVGGPVFAVNFAEIRHLPISVRPRTSSERMRGPSELYRNRRCPPENSIRPHRAKGLARCAAKKYASLRIRPRFLRTVRNHP